LLLDAILELRQRALEPNRPSALWSAPSARLNPEASLRPGAGGERHETDGERGDGKLEP
jgi:hypothetical protein